MWSFKHETRNEHQAIQLTKTNTIQISIQHMKSLYMHYVHEKLTAFLVVLKWYRVIAYVNTIPSYMMLCNHEFLIVA